MGGLIVLIIVIVLVKVASAYSDFMGPEDDGDFICPKCGRKSGVERGPGDMFGATDPWRRFRCKKCGFRW